MRLTALLDKEKQAKYLSIIKKKITHSTTQPVPTVPVFVFGQQRSGTSMLMFSFHFHPDTEVFDESSNNKAFLGHRIRSFKAIEELVRHSRFPFACFKPLADSHLIREFILQSPEGRFIWMYRDFRDVANSYLRRFTNPTRAIRIVCNNHTGGGWFQEGISMETAEELRRFTSPGLSEFDFACLAWWARNRIFLENDLHSQPNIVLLKYEDIVSNPEGSFSSLFRFVGLQPFEKCYKHIHRKSIAKNRYEGITPAVRELCEDLLKRLDLLRYQPDVLR
ncbi:MAG: sulfotransferase [Thermodesulfobacteriota bacterium]|nr:sulfotransferase [Thermodesulfobacteriota bacterium]